MLNVLDGMPQEAPTQAPEFIHRVGSEESDTGVSAALLRHRGRWWQQILQMRSHSARRRFGRIHNSYMRWRHASQQGLKQRIVRASQNQNVRVLEAFGKSLGQVDTSYLLGHRMLDPAFLNQRNEQRTSLLPRIESASIESFPISVTADCSLGANDDNFLISAYESGRLGARLNYSNDWHVSCGRDAIQSQGGRGVAGNNQQRGSIAFEEVGGLHGITCHRFHRLRAVGKPRRVAKVGVVRVRNKFK